MLKKICICWGFFVSSLAAAACCSVKEAPSGIDKSALKDPYANTPYAYCVPNRFSVAAIKQAQKNLLLAFGRYNVKSIADLFSYPVRVNVNHSAVLIQTKKELIATLPEYLPKKQVRQWLQLYHSNTQLSKNIIEPICRYDGVGFFNGAVWFHRNKLGALVGFVINAPLKGCCK